MPLPNVCVGWVENSLPISGGCTGGSGIWKLLALLLSEVSAARVAAGVEAEGGGAARARGLGQRDLGGRRRLRRIRGQRGVPGYWKSGGSTYLIERPPAEEDNDEQVNQRRDGEEPGGEDRPQETVETGLWLVWHLFWLGKERNRVSRTAHAA